MPTDAPVQFTPPNLLNYCFSSWNQLAIDFVSRMTGYLPGTFALPVFGDATPGVDDRDKFWVRTIANRFDGIYTYDPTIALWTTKFYPEPDGGAKVQLYTGDPTLIPTLDGGSNVPVTAYQGPFWAIATEFAARFPLGLGTLPSGLVIGDGTPGGEENHTLLLKEIPSHTHDVILPNDAPTGTKNAADQQSLTAPGPSPLYPAAAQPTGGDPTTTPPNQTAPHNNMPPYVGVTFIRRTARIYKTLPP
jgi:hypothetical protein